MATLNKYFKIDGTASRREFWYFVLFTGIISFGAGIVDYFVTGIQLENIMTVLLFIPYITAAIRRMHDTDHSGFWLLCPIVNFIFLVTPSKPSRWTTIEN